MKQQDIAVLIIIVFFAGIVSFFVSSKVAPSNKKLSAEKVPAIDASFATPDSKIFNSTAVNPTVRIQIGPVANPQPFSDANQ